MAMIGRQLGFPGQRRGRGRSRPRGRIVPIVVGAAILMGLASFYIYQRVWVRSLISDIDQLRDTNQSARLVASDLRARWMSASSLKTIEEILVASKMDLRPTPPVRNLSLKPDMTVTSSSRFAGLSRAMEKIRKSVPLISTNDADAGEIFKQR